MLLDLVEFNLILAELRKCYTFENFKLNNGSMDALSAAISFEEGETTQFPLVIYGGKGLGKTHLLHSVANIMLESNQVR